MTAPNLYDPLLAWLKAKIEGDLWECERFRYLRDDLLRMMSKEEAVLDQVYAMMEYIDVRWDALNGCVRISYPGGVSEPPSPLEESHIPELEAFLNAAAAKQEANAVVAGTYEI